MPRNDAFYLEEYKALRQDIATRLKERLEFSRWGLVGLAALYVYAIANPAPILFWVPVFLTLLVLAHLNEEHRTIAIVGTYIKEQIEPWAARGAMTPLGWEAYWQSQKSPSSWLPWRRWPWSLWDWAPVPLWISLFGITVGIAIGVSVGLRW